MGPARPRGIVAAGHDATADAAAVALRAGGNAFDAAVAAGFAATVCEPGLTSLAGGGFLLARTADGHDRLVDFFVTTPGLGLGHRPTPVFDEVSVSFGAADQTFHCGPGSVAVPGTLAGLLHIHETLGRLPLASVVAPAADLAERGVTVGPAQAAVLTILEPILRRTPASRAIFLPHGRLLTAEDTLRNPDLATFLRSLATAAAGTFYRGPSATHLAAQLAADGGLLTVDDLAAYRVVEREPLRFEYRGRTVVTNPSPTFGGPLLALALHRLEARGPLAAPGTPAWAEALRDVMAEVDRDRADAHPEVVKALRPPPGETAGPPATRGTTHLTVADREGNVASMTCSNGECSGDVIDGTGISCNNMLGEDDLHPDGFHAAPPGVRVASMMSPTFVLGPDGEVDLALGSGGSKRIRSALLQVITSTVDHGLDLRAAVEQPRLHWDRDHTEVEPGLAATTLAALARAAPVNPWPAPNVYFGGVHAVIPGRAGAGDPRRGGAVRVV